MISTKKDAATIRAVIQKLRSVPKPNIFAPGDDGIGAERQAQAAFSRYVETYVIPDLLALLPDSEKPRKLYTDKPL